MLTNYIILENCPVFIGLSLEEIKILFGQIHFQVKKYSDGQVVAHAGDNVEKLIVVLNGSVKGEMVDFSGKTIKIEDIEAPKPLAIAFMFGRCNKYPVNVVSNKQSELLLIPKESVLKLFTLNQTILLNYLNTISDRSQFLSNKIRFLSFQSVRGKIANYILQLTQRDDSQQLTLPLSQNQMAELFGVARPSVGRGMRELHNEGILHVKGKDIRILNMSALKRCLV
ncbi:cAMP-binding domain of CRP or a regulatory subunit of cAMP-dependent protein kinases [Saccharicrinis carchari]|uniref:cAMP-binding domain of CRP or a regulatory subunit of cAMP-dependent protein kinases n=1 Tax=Saccharicrinis carchari TaxID=1168039 RepID=A0A521BDR1_SACCC|nr:Crp/Fnr family transcriptional regulator [Saccharicrinis carchari]SMO45226.1 cAMP-binding domain of CRP or a regulatory subunit of cAMP-dependent protein kinases [Saccharicrinis carchari]